MWEAIAYVSSGFTLAAFIAAVSAWVLKEKSEEKRKLISLADDANRAELVQSALEFFHVETEGLTKEQKYQIAMRQIQARADRFRTTAILIGCLATTAAILSAYAISELGAGVSTQAEPENPCALPFDQRPLDCLFRDET